MSAPNKRTIVQLLALFLLLAALPAGSWYYLKSGLDYHRKAMAELKDLGVMPMPQAILPAAGAALPADSLKNRLAITGFVSLSEEAALDQYGADLSKLHEQFDERKDVIFVTYAEGDSSSMTAFVDKYQLLDETQCYFFVTDAQQIQQAKAAYHLPAENPGQWWIALTDTNLKLRRFYEADKQAEVKRLVEHIALLAPRIKERDLLYKREREK
ncbi:MAG: hypothetical protein HUU34_11430 [Saprospiraceae bacterium]|jgi:hypothetical protein|nr:hypothetical protein [Saprospiraceae bacterium]